MTKGSLLLIHDPKAASIDTRYLSKLAKAGIKCWTDLVKAATDSPHRIYAVKGVSPDGISQIRTALNTEKVEHGLTKKR